MTNEPFAHVFDEMKAYVGFGREDEVQLQAFWPIVEPHAERIVAHFYERAMAFPAGAAVLHDDAQVRRLMATMKVWMRELLLGPHDHAYFQRRERIGRRHVDVGLPPRFMFVAMSVMREDLCGVAHDVLGARARPVCEALARATELDLAIMTGTFIERREERQLKTLQELLVERMPVSVLLLDDLLMVTAATGISHRLFGDMQAIGRPIADALPEALVVGANLLETIDRAIASGREIQIVRVDVEIEGKERSFRLTVVPLDHASARVLVHLEELTETVQTEARMQRSEALAQLGALSAAVAHELRNPLAGISGAVQVIGRSLAQDDRRRPIMMKVEEQIQRLNAMVTELLAFSRPGTARISDVDLAETARGVVSLIQAEHPGVRFEVVGQAVGRADKNFVYQIVLNLVQNAVQAQGEQGLVQVRVEPGRVTVMDAGPGVPEELREEIFRPFFTTRTRGTGLGLAICQRVAQTMHATLSLSDQRPLGGAAFVLEMEPA